ncbi:MAG: hypothetical protein B7Z55_09210 [Planctomycetales bacterium 12-60-4]|nr:MAG: hypothetical protein B7Z55_09210 [Planctomycetales bacterium 12-60-4]
MGSEKDASDSQSAEKQFTVDSANKTLPLVRAIVRDIVELYRDVSERKSRLEGLRKRRGKSSQSQDDPYREEVEQIQQDLDKDVAKLQGFVDELNDIGIELKDPAVGLVDFPTQMDGKTAFLCWQLGETEVQFWHTVEAGYANKEPLTTRPTDHAV